MTLAAVLVHARSIAFDFTYLDDRDLVVDDHAFLASPAGLLDVFRRSYMHIVDAQHPYYRPLVTLSYAIDARWSGMRAFGYHLTNVVLHAIASLLFLSLLRRIDFGRLVACIAALVFAVHPVIASAVAWIPGRNDLLFTVFALSSWLFFLSEMTRPRWHHRLFHVAFFWLALFTKETAVVIPAVCAAHLALVEPGTGPRWRASRAAFALVGGWLAGILGRLTIHSYASGAKADDVVRNIQLMATGLGELAAPVGPALVSVREDLPFWPGVVVGVLIAGATHFTPGVRWRVVTLGVAAFVLFLAPSLAVPGALVLESRLYMPACGFIIAVAEIVRALARERTVLVAFSGVTVVVLAAVTAAYEGTFRDRRSFAHSAVASAPHSALAHFCLGQTYQIDGDSDRALGEYRMALTLGATYAVHNNIAVIHMANARWPEAESELREELAIDPSYPLAYRNLAVVLRREGRIDEASSADERARDLAQEDRPPRTAKSSP